MLGFLKGVGAILTNGHFVYTSGKHGDTYINKDALYPHPNVTSILCRGMAAAFAHDNIEVVVAPAIGAVILSQWVAYHLTELTGREVLAIYAEKEEYGGEPAFVIKRGYEQIVPGKRVLVVEDVLTTGGSARKVVIITRGLGGDVIGVGALCNRGGIMVQDIASVPKLNALVNLPLQAWDPHLCPLCGGNVPINTQVGKGREFLALHPA
ncbi:MAG: phosphoribosyltransferase family protein [Patescibacteria group bacterium]